MRLNIVLAGIALFSGSAWANCPNGLAPGGVYCANVGTDWTCIPDPIGVDLFGTFIVAVANIGGSCTGVGTDYCVWGTDTAGAGFCEEIDDNALTSLTVHGSATLGDTITFDDTANSGEIMADNSTAAFVVGFAFGNGDNDNINGSPDNTASYQDRLDGGPGLDTIWGSFGADFIYGGSGDDVLFGDGGTDTICPGTGANDEAYGGNQDDRIWDNAMLFGLGDGGANDRCGGGYGGFVCELVLGASPC